MKLRTTHTYVTMEVSSLVYDEVAEKLREAGCDHVFNDDGEIDMQGIALVRQDRTAEIIKSNHDMYLERAKKAEAEGNKEYAQELYNLAAAEASQYRALTGTNG